MGLQPGTGWPMYFFMLARCFWMILRAAAQAQRVSACTSSAKQATFLMRLLQECARIMLTYRSYLSPIQISWCAPTTSDGVHKEIMP